MVPGRPSPVVGGRHMYSTVSADKGNGYGPTVGICTVPDCVLYLASFLYISLEKTRLPVLSDPRPVCVPADNTPDGF